MWCRCGLAHHFVAYLHSPYIGRSCTMVMCESTEGETADVWARTVSSVTDLTVYGTDGEEGPL